MLLAIMITFRVLAIGAGMGVVFAVLDGLLNANPIAQNLYAAYKPIARQSVNAPLGMLFDIVSGIVMAILFVTLAPALPGGTIAKGLGFGLIAWFFRVAMGVASQMVMFNIPGSALAYMAFAGLVEMGILGFLYGIALRSR